MKVVHKNLVHGRAGSVRLIPQEADDMWHAYNLIREGDTCTAVTSRKLGFSYGGRVVQKKVLIELEVAVLGVEYDKDGPSLRVRGKVVSKNDFVNIRAFHTLEIEQNRPFVLTKDAWDSAAIEDILKLANCAPAPASADIAVVLLQDSLAHILLIGQSVTVTHCTRVDCAIPHKYGRDKAMKKFFERVMQAFLKEIDFKVVRCVVVASPGFTKDRFREYLFLESERQMVRDVIDNKSKIILAHASSGYEHSLREILQSPIVMKKIGDTKAAKEVRALNDFYTMLSHDASRACYGSKHVESANEERAIQTLLIMDELFRNSDFKTRQKYVDLVESVKASGGVVHIFRQCTPSGQQLGQITGVAAILRFPLYELDDLEIVI